MTAITTAARLLRVAADELKNAHTLGGDWGNEHEALDAYNEHMATATTLEHMARQCLQQIEEPSGAAPAAVAGPAWGALRALSARWLARAADAIPMDAMLINKHIRELSEVLAAQPGETAHDSEIAGLEASCATLGRLVDELRPDGERLEWLLRRLSGSALRAYIGIAGDTGDMAALRELIDAHRGTASAPAPALEAPAAPDSDLALIVAALEHGQPQMAHYAEPRERHALALAAARRMAAAPQAPAAPAENMVRYCPGCGSVGTVESKYRDCCPDGGQARFIPQALAEKCRDTFKLAVDGLVSPQAAPAAPAVEQAFAEWWDRERGTARNRLPGDDWMDLSNEDREQYEAAFNAGMRAAKAAPAAPAVDAWLQPDDMAALQRFHETAEDDESYDIGKEAVARLCAFGCLQSHGFGRYSTTDFGDYLLDTWAGARTLPFTTAAERATERAAQAKEGGEAA